MKKQLAQKELKRILHYNHNTGIFTWLISNAPNTEVGQATGYLNNRGYLTIGIKSSTYPAHRLSFLYMEGFLPKNIDIDHKNKCKTDNRWVNLRLISRQCNIRNCKVGVNNTSGVTGVSWDGRLNKWTSQIHLNLKKHHLGCSNDFNEAVLLRLAAEECLDWNLCNSNSSAYLYAKKHKLIKF